MLQLIEITAAKAPAAVQLDVTDEVDEQIGRITGKTSTYALVDSIRMMDVADDSIAQLATRDGTIRKEYFLEDTK